MLPKRSAPPGTLTRVATAASPTQPIPIVAIPAYQSAAVVLFVPARSRAHILAQTLSPVRRRPAGNKDSGVRRSPAADDRDQGGKKHPLCSDSIPGGRRGTFMRRDFPGVTARPAKNVRPKKIVHCRKFPLKYTIYTYNTCGAG